MTKLSSPSSCSCADCKGMHFLKCFLVKHDFLLATQLALSKSKKKELLSSALQVKGKTCAFLISCLGSVISQMTRAARVSLEKHCCGWALLLKKNLQRIDFELEDFLHLHDSTVLFDPPKSSNYKSSKT